MLDVTYIKHVMNSRDKEFIKSMVCAKFDLDTLKAAREVLFTVLEPSAPGYRGPNGDKSMADRIHHVFDIIFAKLCALDQSAEASNIVIACPSTELHLISPSDTSASVNSSAIDIRFLKLENDMNDLKLLVKPRMEEIQKTLLGMIPDKSKEDDPFPPMPRERSDSKRKRSESDDDDGYSLTKEQRKRDKRRNMSSVKSSDATSFAKQVIEGKPKPPSKKQFTWGKSTDTNVTGFSGAVPDVFIFRCSLQTEKETISKHLLGKGITIKNIELKSSGDAPFRSFKVSVNNLVDFDKLISGEFIPRYVKVRPWANYSKLTDSRGSWNSSNGKPNQRHPSVIGVKSRTDSIARDANRKLSHSVDDMVTNSIVDTTV